MERANISQVVEHPCHMQVWTDLGVKWVPKDLSSIDYVELVRRLEQNEFQVTKAESDMPFTALFAPN